MDQLIEITTIPIELEFKTSRARIEASRGTAEMQISRDKGGLNIKSSPIRLNLDTFEARNSITPTLARSIQKRAVEGKQAAYEATASYAQQGQLLLKTRIGEEMITKFAEDAINSNYKANVGIQFLPSEDAQINWDEGDMTIRYEMDKLNFDWKINKGDFNFIPGDIEISVKQMPDVTIKYVGGAIYVPPSADPNYTPIDVEA